MGTFLAILIIGLGIVVAKSMYSSRDRICLGKIGGVCEGFYFTVIVCGAGPSYRRHRQGGGMKRGAAFSQCIQ